MNNQQQCSIIENEYNISKSLYNIINNISSIDRKDILAYKIHDTSLKRKVFAVWKKDIINIIV